VEAVTVHSYFNWSGKNDIAKILRDSDKLSAFGPLGLLRTVGFNIKNFVNVNDILSSYNSFERITSLASQTLISLNKDKELAQKYLNGDLKKILEWVDGKMFHSEKVYSIFADRIGYTLKVRDFLSKNSSNLFV
jgi:hypothetical protein